MKQWREKNKEHDLSYRKQYNSDNLERRRGWSRKWKENNREYLRHYGAKFYKENRAQRLLTAKKSYQNHRQSRLEKCRQYREKNREEIRKRRQAYSVKNKELIRIKHAEWYKKNSHKAIAASARRRAMELQRTIGNQSIMLAWEKSWRGKPKAVCYWCKSKFSTKKCVSEHIVPLAKGGPHSVENLCISCAVCNNRKFTKSIDQWNSEISSPTLSI